MPESLRQDLIRLINKLSRQRDLRERALASKLKNIYAEARQQLYVQFLEAYGDQDTLRLQYLEGTLAEIEKGLKYYTRLAAGAREEAITENHIMGQQFGIDSLRAGGVNISIQAGIGLINKGAVEALMGNMLKLAGRVETDALFKIREELTRGVTMGESIPKLAKRIFGTGLTQEGMRKPFPSIERRCLVIARTEVIKASDQGYEDAMVEAQKAIGEEIFDGWITAGDSRVEPECRAIAEGRDSRFKSVPGMPGVYKRDEGPRPVIHTHPQ